MKESQFIKQNKEKWLESERVLASKEKDTDQLSSLFIQLVDDLSYARTFFSYRFITVYLNQTSMKFFSQIYTRKKSKWANFMEFWKEELPQVVIHCRKELLIALLVFTLAVIIGVVSSINDPEFVASILGKQYVEMTKENINSGDPMAVYKKSNQYGMFLGITINNILVAFRSYAFGLLAGIGTISSLLFNGIMLGAFQYFFYEHHLLGNSMLAVWLHGTIEISSLIIAGGAGLTLARGLIIPGTLSRMQSFYRSASRSLKLMLGTVPLFIFAGFIESFVTRYTEVPGIVRLAFILASLSFIIGYFVVYPYLKSRKGFNVPLKEVKLSPARKEGVPFGAIKTNADVFKDTFFVYFQKFGVLSIGLMIGSIVLCFFHHFIGSTTYQYTEDSSWTNLFLKSLFILFNAKDTSYVAICGLVTGWLLFFINHIIYKSAALKPATGTRYYTIAIINSLITATTIHLAIFSTSEAGVFFIAVLLPFVLLLNYVAHAEGLFLLLAIPHFFKILTSSFLQITGMVLMLIITSVLFTLILDSPILYVYMEEIKMNIDPNLQHLKQIVDFISFSLSGFILLSVLAFNSVAIALLYYSGHEIITAGTLKEKVSQLMNPKPKYAV